MKSLFDRILAVSAEAVGLPAAALLPDVQPTFPNYQRFADAYQFDSAAVPEGELFDLVSELYRAYRIDQPLVHDELYNAVEGRLLAIDPNALSRIEATLTDTLYRNDVELPHEMSGIQQINANGSTVEATVAALQKFISRFKATTFMLGDKLDGISLLLKYVDGKFKAAYTKHTGNHGLDVTRHVLGIPSVIKEHPYLEGATHYLRGEAIMKVSTFKEHYAADYANPRNFVAGKFGAKVTDASVLEHIDFVAYTWCDSGLTKDEQLEVLAGMGFLTPEHSKVVTADELTPEYLDAHIYAMKSSGPYEYDGLVIDPIEFGVEGWKYKAPAELFKVVCEGVDWALHKDGDFRCRVMIEPTQIGGVTVTHASAFNARYIKNGRLESETWKPIRPIGKGAILTVIRAGDVIPDIQWVDEAAPGGPDFPSEEQWGPMEWDDNGVHLRTSNPDHPVVKFRNLDYFSTFMGIEGFRGASVSKVLDAYPDIDFVGVLQLDKAKLIAAGFGAIEAYNIEQAIIAAKTNAYLPAVMASTNYMSKLWGVGRSEKVYYWYEGDCLDWSGWSEDEIVAELRTIPGIEYLTALPFARNIERLVNTIERMKNEAGLTIAPLSTVQVTGDKLAGKIVVFTGTHDKTLEVKVVENGGTNGSWTSSNLIVAVDPSIMRPKIEKLLSKGAEMMSLADFNQLIGE